MQQRQSTLTWKLYFPFPRESTPDKRIYFPATRIFSKKSSYQWAGEVGGGIFFLLFMGSPSLRSEENNFRSKTETELYKCFKQFPTVAPVLFLWHWSDAQLLKLKKRTTTSSTEGSNSDSYNTSKITENFDRPKQIVSFESVPKQKYVQIANTP